MKRTVGILPLARPTFDVAFATEKFEQMLRALDETGHRIVGTRQLLLDAPATDRALKSLERNNPDVLLILQVTFTDALVAVQVGRAFCDLPLAIWACPEPRLGGRLRLNAFCGLNLASHALGLEQREFSHLYADPEKPGVKSDLDILFAGENVAGTPMALSPDISDVGVKIARSLKGSRIARIGEHPPGFDTCAYDRRQLADLAGVVVEELPLERLFDKARAVSKNEASGTRAEAARDLEGLEELDQEQLDRSLRLKNALADLRSEGRFDAFAIRCWPETFTEYGGAVCGPVSMMGEAKIPCACEADVYGAVTQLLLQSAADAPVFLADLVDLDVDDDTGVIWHCGQAPLSMCDPDLTANATIHTNRKMPLLYEFALKPGRVTFARISQAKGETRMVVAGGEMLKRPMAFTGTSGVVRFDSPAASMMDRIIGSGMEHHMALAYGDHRDALAGTAAALSIPFLEL